MFDGDVRERLEVAVWISADRGDNVDLSAITTESPGDVVDQVEALLATTSDRVIGLYRAEFRPEERFGAARLAVENKVRTTDFTFDLIIEEITGRPSVSALVGTTFTGKKGATMETRRIKLGEEMWKVSRADAASVAATIESAMNDAQVVKLSLLSGDDTPATVIFNGRVATLAVIDDGAVPRPTEISGSMGRDNDHTGAPTHR